MEEYILRNNTTTLDRRVDAIIEEDERNKNFPVSFAIRKPINKIQVTGPTLDQEGEGACHIEGTEVLTDNGQKDFRDVELSDKLATVCQKTHSLEFQNPTQLVKYDYTGEMVTMNSKNLSFSVTPDHRMYVRKQNEKMRTLDYSYQFVIAKDIGQYTGLLDAPNGSKEQKEFEDITIKGITINNNDLASFIGIFLAEGCLYHPKDGSYRIEIAAVKEQCRPIVYNLVKSLGFTVTENKDRYTMHNKELFNFLSDMYGSGALTKKVPDFIKNAPKEQIELFLDAFCVGDGHVTKDGRKFFYTSSKQLADDLQELLLRIGVRSKIIRREPRDANILGRFIPKENISPSYVVSPQRKKTLSIGKKSQLKNLKYSGMVYCATVPNSTLITRFKGTVLISGNCVAFSLTHALTSEKHRINIPRNIKLTEEYAVKKIYQEAQKIDDFPGGEYPGARPKQGGTSLESGLRILRKLGLIKGYEWGYSLMDLILGVGYIGPAILVIPQRESMYEIKRQDKFLDISGYKVGYHAIMVCSVDAVKQFFVLQNSQGTSYGFNGKCGITFKEMDKIFNDPFQIAFLKTK